MCNNNGWNYRISSDLFPLFTLNDSGFTFSDIPDNKSIIDSLKKCGEFIIKNNIRVSLHPGQFTILPSEKSIVIENSIKDLEYHAWIFDSMGLDCSYKYPINIHVGLRKGDVYQISDKFIESYLKLSNSVKARLCIENEDSTNSWKVNELYDNIYNKIKIPITYDSLHYRCNPDVDMSPIDAYNKCRSTWPTEITPLFHFSNSFDLKNKSKHSDYVLELHDELFSKETDIDFEFKSKDLCIQKFESEYVNKNGVFLNTP